MEVNLTFNISICCKIIMYKQLSVYSTDESSFNTSLVAEMTKHSEFILSSYHLYSDSKYS